jgi:peptidoglycan-associated lipoprotein
MRDSKPDFFLNGQTINFSNTCQRAPKMRSLIHCGLLVACIFLLKTASPGWSFTGEQVTSLDSSFNPVEIAQLSPGRVQVLEGEPEDAKESRLQFTDNTLKQAGFILPETSPVGTIIKSFGSHDSFSFGEIVYLDIGSANGATKGSTFTIFRKVRPILHPVLKGNIRETIPDYERPLAEPHPTYFSRAGKRMGHLVHPLGTLEILESTANSSKAIIRASYDPIEIGDFVTPFEKLSNPPRLPEAKGEESLEAYVIAFKREHYIGGLNEILYIDRGSNDKVIPGDRFEIYVTPTHVIDQKWYELDPKEVPLIPQVVSEVQVLDTQKETSTAIVISGFHSIPLGARVRYKPVDVISPPLSDVVALQDAPIYPPAAIEIPLEQTQEPLPAEEPFADFDPNMLEEEEIGVAEMLAFSPTEALEDIHFKFDQYDLDEMSRKTLLTNVEYLHNHPNIQIRIEGYCDERGTNNYNLALGERRALSVKNFLSSQGIEEHRLHLISYGEEKPFCNDSQESCWSQNRKVHFMASGSSLPVN